MFSHLFEVGFAAFKFFAERNDILSHYRSKKNLHISFCRVIKKNCCPIQGLRVYIAFPGEVRSMKDKIFKVKNSSFS